MNTNVNVEIMQSEMLTLTLEREMRKLIKKAQKEVLEVCAKEYKFDINAALLLVNAGGERKDKVVKEKVVKEKVVKEKVVKEKKSRAKKEVVEGDRKGSRGRPKNPEKVVEVEETENLFEQLVNTQLEQVEEDVACCVVFQTKEETKAEQCAEKKERGLMSGEEKETKVANKAEAKEAEKLAKEKAKESEKLAKEQAKEQEKLAKLEAIAAKEAAKEQEKLAKLEAIAAKEAAKEQAKLAKEAEKLAKAIASGSDSDTSSKSKKEKKTKVSAKKTKETAERIEKETNDVEYQAKMTELSEKLEAAPGNKLAIPVVAVVAAEAPATLKVKSFKYEGATYFREKTTGAIYDKETNDHLGQWNEATQKIDFLEVEEELEEEEESAGESSDEEEEEDA